ncbi:type II CAAX endopeptidase family protein [Kribbella sp. HUAS MG21]|uniref:Type II CAAX endopeptidase family protein n=1 Tax=Kribbella sp. HUAS MG21 TaxID=3160966 RepID=A0AAU7T9N8_9ACTN
MDPQEPRPAPRPGPSSQPGQYPPPPPHPGAYPPPGPYPPYPQHPQQQWGAPGPYPQQWGGPGPYPQQYAQREPRTVEAPSGTPFHRLARTAKHRWWRPIAGTLVLGTLAVTLMWIVTAAWVIAHELLGGPSPQPDGANLFPSDTENLAFNLVLLGVLTPLVGLVAWIIQRRPFWSVASVLNRIRWRWLLWCSLPALGYVGLSIVTSIVVDPVFPPEESTGNTDTDGSWVGWAAFVVPALLILLLVPFQSAAEEFVFRGWLVQAVGAYGPDSPEGRGGVLRKVFRSPWPGIVVGGVAFISAHGYTGWAMVDVFLFAVTVGWLTVRTGGLEAAIAVHVTNNLFAFLLPAATGGLSDWDEQGGAPWTLLAADLPCLVFYAYAITWMARRREIQRLS